MYQSNCDDAQTDQSLDLSYFLQINVLGKQTKSHTKKKRCYMYVKREIYRMRRLILIFAIRTC